MCRPAERGRNQRYSVREGQAGGASPPDPPFPPKKETYLSTTVSHLTRRDSRFSLSLVDVLRAQRERAHPKSGHGRQGGIRGGRTPSPTR
eukprot:6551908-Prymnesium_polylepis.2